MLKSTLAVVRSERFLEHRPPSQHFENPTRLTILYELFDEDPVLAALPTLPLVEATRELLESVHAKSLVSELALLRNQHAWIDADTYVGPSSIEIAQLAVGSTVQLGLEILKGRYRRGFSLVRPPGHHATPFQAMGFCLFNNIAVTAQALLNERKDLRIAIVDFDLHHGNGTQDFFYSNPDVFFVSSHRYPFYPGTGASNEMGVGKGVGTTLNLPISTRVGDDVFLPLYENTVMPQLLQYSPDMILVSAGFDGHVNDPMRGLKVSTHAYGTLARQLIEVAEKCASGRILFCLEGGYDPQALKESVREVLVAAMQSYPDPELRSAS